jgi:PIN domain nuclease of toxin-antitoxin system
MKLLLDSNVIVRWIGFPNLLKTETIEILRDRDTDIFISPVSVWELGIKVSKGNLTLPENYVSRLVDEGFSELAVTLTHAKYVSKLPPIHSDPFDRILIAQAICEGLCLMTTDRLIRRYNLQVVQA